MSAWLTISLTFTRALLRSPKILVPDKATSNLDAVSEQKTIGSLHTLYSDMTVIMGLNNGFLAEHGAHTGLTERNGVYASLFNSMCM